MKLTLSPYSPIRSGPKLGHRLPGLHSSASHVTNTPPPTKKHFWGHGVPKCIFWGTVQDRCPNKSIFGEQEYGPNVVFSQEKAGCPVFSRTVGWYVSQAFNLSINQHCLLCLAKVLWGLRQRKANYATWDPLNYRFRGLNQSSYACKVQYVLFYQPTAFPRSPMT